MATFGDLGERYIDRSHNWSEDREIFSRPIREYQKFIEKTKLKSYEHEMAPPMSWLPPTKSQRVALCKVTKFLQQPDYEQELNPLRMLIVGGAGVGKTWVIERISAAFHEKGLKYLVTAPTGPASHLIGGVTLHSAFSVPYMKEADWETLVETTTPSPKLQEKLQGLKLLIIDEVTLLGAGFLNFINIQLQLCLNNTQPFANISVILVGDVPSQIPPIGDVALYRKPDNYCNFYKQGINLYRSFKDVVVLKECVRAQFCEDQKTLLRNLRRKKIGTSDIKILSRRLEKNVDPDILQSEFHECVRLFPKRAMCNIYNRKRITEEKMPVIKITSKQVPALPVITKYEPLVIGKGVKVMLCRNLDTARGLTTGARGVVRGIIWDKKKTAGTDLPAAIMIEFEKRIPGPKVELNCIPIPPCVDYFYCRMTDRTYKTDSFALKVCYAATIHSIQGQTLDKACIYLDTCFAENQDYVALSRTRSVDDFVLLDSNVTVDRFRTLSFYKGVASQFAEMERLGIDEDIKGDSYDNYSDSSETEYDDDAGFGSDSDEEDIELPDALNNSQLENFRKNWISEIDERNGSKITAMELDGEDRRVAFANSAKSDSFKENNWRCKEENPVKRIKWEGGKWESYPSNNCLPIINPKRDQISVTENGILRTDQDPNPWDLSQSGSFQDNSEPMDEDVVEYPLVDSDRHADHPDRMDTEAIPDFLSLGLTEPADRIIANYLWTPQGNKVLKALEDHSKKAAAVSTPAFNNSSEVQPNVWQNRYAADPRLTSSWYNNNNNNSSSVDLNNNILVDLTNTSSSGDLNTPTRFDEIEPTPSPMAVPSFSPLPAFEWEPYTGLDALLENDNIDQLIAELETAALDTVHNKENYHPSKF